MEMLVLWRQLPGLKELYGKIKLIEESVKQAVWFESCFLLDLKVYILIPATVTVVEVILELQ